MKIKLHTVNLEVADPQAAKRFYVEALGMSENLQRSHAPGFVYLESADGGSHLTLATSQGVAPGAKPSPTMELGFEVDDLAALQTRLAETGVTGFKPQRMGWGEVIEGHDPDGHRVIVYRLR